LFISFPIIAIPKVSRRRIDILDLLWDGARVLTEDHATRRITSSRATRQAHRAEELLQLLVVRRQRCGRHKRNNSFKTIGLGGLKR
jgi:hypothetical protein